MQTNFSSRVTLIVIVLLAAIWAIFPALFTSPATLFNRNVPLGDKLNLRPGIDMVGGTSLLYEIKPPQGVPPSSDLANQVMEALKKRVDPDGVRNLIWRPQGSNRLEIQMPLSGKTKDSGAKRKEFAAAQAKLEATNIRPLAVIDAVENLSGEARAKKLEQYAMGSDSRKKLFADLANTYDAIEKAKKNKDAAAQADAEIKYEDLKTKLDATNINVADLQEQLGTAGGTELQAKINDVIAKNSDFPARVDALKDFEVAYADYNTVKSSLDDSSDLKRLLKGSGVLEFHILIGAADRDVANTMMQRTSPSQQAGDTARWYRVERPEEFGRHNGVTKEFNGKLYVLCDQRVPEKALTSHMDARWSLQSAYPTRDGNTGDMVVGFTFDPQGAKYFADLTGQNIGQPMAIILDDKVISAPNINSQISGSGIISGGRGGYTPDELSYLVNTLNAGSLPAQLADEPISERSVGSSLGADNLRAGLMSCGFGLIVVAVFLTFYYHIAGIVATCAVVMNVVLILGVLAALNATFTLPSIAGIVLTIGTAVDANVLVFERLREEQHRGLGIRLALRNAYERAFSAILDSNMTTAITSAVLYLLGSEEVKGFGLTLLIGIVCSLFTALFVTRTVFSIMVERFGLTRLGSFPDMVPAWDRLLKPKIDWMGLIWPFVIFSVVSISIGLFLFKGYLQKREVFDIEFASGTAVQFEFKQPTKIEDVRKMVHDADPNEKVLPSPTIVAVGAGDLAYEVVTANANAPEVRDAILKNLGEKLNLERPSQFALVNEPIERALGKVVVPVADKMSNVPFMPNNLDQFKGGVAIYLDNLEPKLTPQKIKERIDGERLQLSGPMASQEFFVQSPAGPDEPTSSAAI
jgi:SecD/SecF fusion protein